MPTFSGLVEEVVLLSKEEMEELRGILNKKLVERRRQEILTASEEAMKEYEEGKSISLKTPQEIKKYFTEIFNED
ncbi:MAG: hypothetical protein H0U39_03380 [Segetibacter sp.]|nr:hypothetical protein [Segetibacter sp.]